MTTQGQPEMTTTEMLARADLIWERQEINRLGAMKFNLPPIPEEPTQEEIAERALLYSQALHRPERLRPSLSK